MDVHIKSRDHSTTKMVVSSIFPLKKHNRPYKPPRSLHEGALVLTQMPQFKKPSLKSNDQFHTQMKESEEKLLNHQRFVIAEHIKYTNHNNLMLIAKKIKGQQPLPFNQQPLLIYPLPTRNPALQQQRTEMPQIAKTANNSIMQVNAFPITRYAKSLMTSRNTIAKTSSSQSEPKPKPPSVYGYLITTSNNNEDLVRRILSIRPNWKQMNRGEGIPTFKWLAGDYPASYFKKFSSHAGKRMINQFEGHSQITTKNGMIRNLQFYCETRKKELFSITPITFVLDFQDQYCEFHLRQFLNFFLKNCPSRKMCISNNNNNGSSNTQKNWGRINSFVQKLSAYLSGSHFGLKKKQNPLSKPIMYPEYLSQDGGYMWLLKPTGLNRGRGIQIFDNLETLEKLLLTYLQLTKGPAANTPPSPTQDSKEKDPNNTATAAEALPPASPPGESFVLKNCSFVLQKYIQRPLLIQGRKFDIRVWVLLTHQLHIYFFKQGYLRLSSEMYSMDISNYFVHLTNNAIQKYSPNYCAFESGNQLSFANLAEILTRKHSLPENYFSETILPKIKQSSHAVINCGRTKLNPNNRQNCFQIFGLDYIIDESMRVWLIEVNNNPCIEESSGLLKQYIPRMLNDAFKLTLDKLFPVPATQDRGESINQFRVDGYSDKENMWQPMGRLSPNAQYQTTSISTTNNHIQMSPGSLSNISKVSISTPPFKSTADIQTQISSPL